MHRKHVDRPTSGQAKRTLGFRVSPGATRVCTMSKDDDNYQDLLAAYAYLGGFTKHDKRGVPRQRYWKQDSREEKDCRAAFARVLRSRGPLDHQLREMLAQLFDPDPGTETIWGIRKLTISFRANRRPRDHNANRHMA